jgi:hypothetical protein
MLFKRAQICEAVMPWAMTSFEVKLSVVPGWKWRGQMMADCFELSPGIAIVVGLSCLLGFDESRSFDVLEQAIGQVVVTMLVRADEVPFVFLAVVMV